jgi:hypothetical protein
MIKERIAANKIYVNTFQKVLQHNVSIQHSSYIQQLYFQQQIKGIHAISKINAIENKTIITIPPSIKSQKL